MSCKKAWFVQAFLLRHGAANGLKIYWIFKMPLMRLIKSDL